MNKATLMQRIEQHFDAKSVTRGTDLAVLLEDICWQVYQWAVEDSAAPAPDAKTTIVAELNVVVNHEIVSVVGFLLDVAQAAHLAMQDCEDCGDHYKVQREDFAALSAAMEKLEALPDDRPGYTLSGPGKAAWALRDRGEADGTLMAEEDARAFGTGFTVDGTHVEPSRVRVFTNKPVAGQGELPPEWISEVCGPEVDDLSYGQGYRRGFNDCRQQVLELRAAIAASQQAAEPVAWMAPDGRVQPASAMETAKRAGGAFAVAMRDFSIGLVPAAAPVVLQPLDERAAFQAEMQRLGYNMTREAADPRRFAFPAMRAAWRAWQARAALAGVGAAAKPNADCSGDPANCPDNEGHGCACDPLNSSAKRLACEVCAGTGTAFGKTCNCTKGASHG